MHCWLIVYSLLFVLMWHPGLAMPRPHLEYISICVFFLVIFRGATSFVLLYFILLILFHLILLYFVGLLVLFLFYYCQHSVPCNRYWCFLPMGEAAVVSQFKQQSALLPHPSQEPHPIGTAKGCCGAAGDILVVALVGHNINIFATTLHIGGRPSTCNQGTRHAVVTWTHLSRLIPKLLLQNTFQYYPSINGYDF